MENNKITLASLAIIIFFTCAFGHKLNASPYWDQFMHPEEINYSLVSAEPCFILPMGDMNQYSEYGLGLLLAYNHNIDNLIFSIKTGTYYFTGKEKDFAGSTESITDYFVMIPLTAGIGYRFDISSWLAITPNINAGASLDILKNAPDGISAIGGAEYETSMAFHPITAGGIDLIFSITKKLSVRLSSSYTTVFEFQGRFTMANFAVAGLGADWSF